MIANLGRPRKQGIMCDKHRQFSDTTEAIANVHRAVDALNASSPDVLFSICMTAYKRSDIDPLTMKPVDAWVNGSIEIMERAKQ